VRADHQPPDRPRVLGHPHLRQPARHHPQHQRRHAPGSPSTRRSLASCLSTCNDASTPDTDRATCRLQCNANGSVGPAPSSYYILGGAPPSDADQRAAVIRSSQGNAGTVTPPSGTPQSQQKIAACAATAQQCATTCTAQSAPCTAACDQGKMSGTDRATCKLTCESNVEVCRDDCRIQEGKCRSKP
jgi:hypothetical protein